MDKTAILALLDKVETEAPDKPFIGSDEWDLCAAFEDGWRAALDAVAKAVRATA
jgi:hypothetical protein